MGTNKGSIRVSVWPLQDNSLEFEQLYASSTKVVLKIPEFYEILVHNSPISYITLTHDNQFLITGDENGFVFILKIQDVLNNG